MGNNTITATSLTYNSDNTFSFDGVSNRINTTTTPVSLQGDLNLTVCGIFKRTASYNNAGVWGVGGGATDQGING